MLKQKTPQSSTSSLNVAGRAMGLAEAADQVCGSDWWRAE